MSNTKCSLCGYSTLYGAPGFCGYCGHTPDMKSTPPGRVLSYDEAVAYRRGRLEERQAAITGVNTMQEEAKSRFSVELEALKKSSRTISDALGVTFDMAWEAGAKEAEKATTKDIIDYVHRVADRFIKNGDSHPGYALKNLAKELTSGAWQNDK